MNPKTSRIVALAVVVLGVASSRAATTPWPAEEGVTRALSQVDRQSLGSGHFSTLVFVEHLSATKTRTRYLLSLHRDGAEDRTIIRFLVPKSASDTIYLRLQGRLFAADLSNGQWKSCADECTLGGTGLPVEVLEVFDALHLADWYEPTWHAASRLGRDIRATQIALSPRSGLDVALPRTEIWIENSTGHLLKTRTHGAFRRQSRTTYFLNWSRIRSKATGADVHLPREVRILLDGQQGTLTTIALREFVPCGQSCAATSRFRFPAPCEPDRQLTRKNFAPTDVEN